MGGENNGISIECMYKKALWESTVVLSWHDALRRLFQDLKHFHLNLPLRSVVLGAFSYTVHNIWSQWPDIAPWLAPREKKKFNIFIQPLTETHFKETASINKSSIYIYWALYIYLYIYFFYILSMCTILLHFPLPPFPSTPVPCVLTISKIVIDFDLSDSIIFVAQWRHTGHVGSGEHWKSTGTKTLE